MYSYCKVLKDKYMQTGRVAPSATIPAPLVKFAKSISWVVGVARS